MTKQKQISQKAAHSAVAAIIRYLGYSCTDKGSSAHFYAETKSDESIEHLVIDFAIEANKREAVSYQRDRYLRMGLSRRRY